MLVVTMVKRRSFKFCTAVYVNGDRFDMAPMRFEYKTYMDAVRDLLLSYGAREHYDVREDAECWTYLLNSGNDEHLFNVISVADRVGPSVVRQAKDRRDLPLVSEFCRIMRRVVVFPEKSLLAGVLRRVRRNPKLLTDLEQLTRDPPNYTTRLPYVLATFPTKTGDVVLIQLVRARGVERVLALLRKLKTTIREQPFGASARVIKGVLDHADRYHPVRCALALHSAIMLGGPEANMWSNFKKLYRVAPEEVSDSMIRILSAPSFWVRLDTEGEERALELLESLFSGESDFLRTALLRLI